MTIDQSTAEIRAAADNLAEILGSIGRVTGHLHLHGFDLESAKQAFPDGYREVERRDDQPPFQVWVAGDRDGLQVTLFCGPVS